MTPSTALREGLLAKIGPVPPIDLEDAACRTRDASLFFGSGDDLDEARQVCRRCDVRRECLSFAIRTNQQFGVWGGLSSEERAAVRRRMRARGELS